MPPRAAISAAVSLTVASSMSLVMISAPSRAKASAVSRPIPSPPRQRAPASPKYPGAVRPGVTARSSAACRRPGRRSRARRPPSPAGATSAKSDPAVTPPEPRHPARRLVVSVGPHVGSWELTISCTGTSTIGMARRGGCWKTTESSLRVSLDRVGGHHGPASPSDESGRRECRRPCCGGRPHFDS